MFYNNSLSTPSVTNNALGAGAKSRGMNFRRHVRPLLLASAMVACMGAYAQTSTAGEPVNINQADAKTLAAAINGVGMKRAQAIIAYRSEHGPFDSVEALSEVPGIGSKTVSDNRDRLKVR